MNIYHSFICVTQNIQVNGKQIMVYIYNKPVLRNELLVHVPTLMNLKTIIFIEKLRNTYCMISFTWNSVKCEISLWERAEKWLLQKGGKSRKDELPAPSGELAPLYVLGLINKCIWAGGRGKSIHSINNKKYTKFI